MTPEECVQEFLQTIWLKENHKPLIQCMENNGRALSWFFMKSPTIILCVESNQILCKNLPPWQSHVLQSFPMHDIVQVAERLSHWIHVRDQYDDSKILSSMLSTNPSVLHIQSADFF